MSQNWTLLQRHYERCLERFGASPRGADWPNAPDLFQRFATQVGVLSSVPANVSRPILLDLGCGVGMLLDYLQNVGMADAVDYRGIDITPAAIELARSRWPNRSFEIRNIAIDPPPPESVDVVIMNGLLTLRREIARDDMVGMAESIVGAAFRSARYGVAFNVMSRHVDYERDDLFHWGFDEVAAFLRRDVTPHYAFRADYGLYEFTTFAWREAQRRTPPAPASTEWWMR